MINRYFVTGDCHGDFSRFRNLSQEIQQDPETAIIILGDAGLNWSVDERDSHIKNKLAKLYKFRIYCVRGNHEARPQNISDMKLIYDADVQGEVYMQDRWPQIRYFKDWGIYQLGPHRIAVIGGAYSVDKWYRLDRGYTWFSDEQLSKEEMELCANELMNKEFDFVFTHTCPIDWEPTDLFLPFIDQSKVDKSMELFLEEIFQRFDWGVACFGHYHTDRIERPYVEQFFKDTENLQDIWDRWTTYSKTKELDWWLHKSPNFYQTSFLRSKLDNE